MSLRHKLYFTAKEAKDAKKRDKLRRRFSLMGRRSKGSRESPKPFYRKGREGRKEDRRRRRFSLMGRRSKGSREFRE
jgi:hypothetical protein